MKQNSRRLAPRPGKLQEKWKTHETFFLLTEKVLSTKLVLFYGIENYSQNLLGTIVNQKLFKLLWKIVYCDIFARGIFFLKHCTLIFMILFNRQTIPF